MSLTDILRHADDKALKGDLRNAFALLTDDGILRVTEALSGMSPAAAASSIITIVGPQEGRVAALIPTLFAGHDLAEADTAAMVFTGVASHIGQTSVSKAEAKAAVQAIPIPEPDKRETIESIERHAMNTLDYALVGRLVAGGLIAVASRYLPILRSAPVSQGIIKGAGTIAGAIFGATQKVESHQSYLPPTP